MFKYMIVQKNKRSIQENLLLYFVIMNIDEIRKMIAIKDKHICCKVDVGYSKFFKESGSVLFI